jgi:hypothetical protein
MLDAEVDMTTRHGVLLLALLATSAGSAQAQNFLMNSAETINKGNFKIAAFPTVLLGEDDADSEWGVATRVGYGFTPSFDVEVKLAFFDGFKLYGADAELWLLKGKTDASVALGLHKGDFEGDFDTTAVDASGIVSRSIGSRTEIYGGLSLSFESVDDVDDSSFTRVHLVPGVEYKLSDDIDLLAEIGLGLNDDSPDYVSFGVALYLR